MTDLEMITAIKNKLKDDGNTKSFMNGVEAAFNGTSINNSYPNNNEEWVKGYQTIMPKAKQQTELKGIFFNLIQTDDNSN